MKRDKLGNTSKVRAGEVFHLRFSPQDIVSCARVCEAVDVDLTKAGLARMISYAVRVLLASARQNGVIPSEEDMFSAYAQIKQMYTFPQRQKLDTFVKLEHNDLMRENLDQPHLAELSAERLPIPNPRVTRLERMIAELVARDLADPLNPHTEEIQALNEQLAEELRNAT